MPVLEQFHDEADDWLHGGVDLPSLSYFATVNHRVRNTRKTIWPEMRIYIVCLELTLGLGTQNGIKTSKVLFRIKIWFEMFLEHMIWNPIKVTHQFDSLDWLSKF